MLKTLICSLAVLSLISCSSSGSSSKRGVSSAPSSDFPNNPTEASSDITAFVDNFQEGPINKPVFVSSIEEFEKTFGILKTTPGSDNRANLQVRQFFKNGGSRAWINRIAPPDWIGSPVSKTGIYALEGEFDILVLPGLATLEESDAKRFRQAALTFVTQQQAFLIIDPPAKLDVEDTIKWRDGATELIGQNYASAYFPRILVDDPASGSTGRFLETSGSMAGIFAKNDFWRSTANTGINGAKDVEYQLDDTTQGKLIISQNGVSINPIRNFPKFGILVWGARTFDGNSPDFRYIQVRRTISVISHTIKSILESYATSPNTKNTWEAIKSEIASYMTSLWKQGGIVGATPADSFQVEMGLGTTMTIDDILAGKMNISLKTALIKPAEFLIINLSIIGQH